MRKMRKFISLAVVFSMLCSLILPGFAHAASDIEGTKYEEAIAKLVALDTIKGYGGCHLAKTVGGQVHFYTNAKSIRVDLGNGIKTYKTPTITIPLIKKR